MAERCHGPKLDSIMKPSKLRDFAEFNRLWGTISTGFFPGTQIFKRLSPYLKAHLKVHPTTCVEQALLNLVLETKKKKKRKRVRKQCLLGLCQRRRWVSAE